MTAGSDEPEDERTHTTGGDSPERQRQQNGEHPADGRDQSVGEETSGSEAAAKTAVSDEKREEWRFSVTDVSDPEDKNGDDEGNVAGPLMRNEPLEPGAIDPENALFFLLGSLGTILFVVLAVSGL